MQSSWSKFSDIDHFDYFSISTVKCHPTIMEILIDAWANNDDGT